MVWCKSSKEILSQEITLLPAEPGIQEFLILANIGIPMSIPLEK